MSYIQNAADIPSGAASLPLYYFEKYHNKIAANDEPSEIYRIEPAKETLEVMQG